MFVQKGLEKCIYKSLVRGMIRVPLTLIVDVAHEVKLTPLMPLESSTDTVDCGRLLNTLGHNSGPHALPIFFKAFLPVRLAYNGESKRCFYLLSDTRIHPVKNMPILEQPLRLNCCNTLHVLFTREHQLVVYHIWRT